MRVPRFSFSQRPGLLNKPLSPCIVGVINLTPDSFSDGGQITSPAEAWAAARQMVQDGAHLIDIGAESTRPGAPRISPADQISRLRPALEALRAVGVPIPLSIDTTSPEVAQFALALGASVINDVSGGTDDPDMLPLAARTGAAVILMHMQGTPATMQQSPTYTDVVTEVGDYLAGRVHAARHAGIPPDQIAIDPGIGFGKTFSHNLALMQALPALKARAGVYTLMIGVSRKGFIGQLLDPASPPPPADRIAGSVAAAVWAARHGADLLRVHDVRPTHDALAACAGLDLSL